MKYRVINHTTLEIIETNKLSTAYEWAADWEKMGYEVEIIVRG